MGIWNRAGGAAPLFHLKGGWFFQFIKAIANKKNNEIDDLSQDSSTFGKFKYFLFQNLQKYAFITVLVFASV